MITGINHLTLATRDLEDSFVFYRDLLGFKPLCKWPEGAYFLAGNLWFCLSVDQHGQAEPNPCYSHIAFNIEQNDFNAMREKLKNADVSVWKENSSEGLSLYILDPSGHKLEIHVGHWHARLEAFKAEPKEGMYFYL